jgi:hypothetical protein
MGLCVLLFSEKTQQALLFVNKKKQKNFDLLKHLALADTNPAKKQKFFASFFQKRSASLSPQNTSKPIAR